MKFFLMSCLPKVETYNLFHVTTSTFTSVLFFEFNPTTSTRLLFCQIDKLQSAHISGNYFDLKFENK
jgi:hypothetical protein